MSTSTFGAVAASASRSDRDLQYISFVREQKTKSERTFTGYFAKLARWYDRYRGIYSGKFPQFRNNIHIPFIYSVIQSDVARKVQMMLGNFPLISFEGYPPEQEPTAKKNEMLVSIQFEDAQMYLKTVDFLTTLDLYGCAIMRTAWRRDIRRERIRIPVPIAPGLTITQVGTQWQTYYDGPDAYVVDPLDFFPTAGHRFLESMPGATERYWRNLDDLRAQVAAERAQGVPPEDLSFDPASLDELMRMGSESDMSSRMIDRTSVYRNQTDFEARKGDRYFKPVEVWEYWGTVPDELRIQGARDVQIIILNGRVLGKARPNPFWHGQKPWRSAAIGEPHYFHGIGKSELMEKMQAASNRLLNHQLDMLDLRISPVFLANSGIFTHQNLVTQPGRVIGVDGPVDDSVIRQLDMDTSGIQLVPPQVENLWRYMQQASGIVEDTIMGSGGADRQTAREYQGRQEAVMTRLMSETRQIEEGWLEPTANLFRALNKQFLTVPKQINMLGSLAFTNNGTGQPLPPDTSPIGYEDLWPDYRARAVGANQATMRATRQQNMIQLLQATTANPMLMSQVNWINFARQMFEVFGFRNINELLIQLPMMGQVANQLGMSPANAATATASPETLSPSHETAQNNAPSGQLQPLNS